MTRAGVIRSMTGYGTASLEGDGLQASVTVRSLNHRYLDLSLHLARKLQELEPDIKRLVQERVHRGRVEVSVQAVLPTGEDEVLVLSRPLVSALVRTLREVRAEHGLAGEVAVSDVARFPGAVEVMERAATLEAGPRSRLLAVVGQALDGLEGMRRAEGGHLREVLEEALAIIEQANRRVESLSEGGREARRQGLAEKVRGLASELGLEDSRLYQEVVRAVERHDVTEEVARLRSHVAQARGLLGGGGPCGKHLDFLAQEMAREANTIGSKAATVEVVQEVVRLKAEVERLREQVQNIE